MSTNRMRAKLGRVACWVALAVLPQAIMAESLSLTPAGIEVTSGAAKLELAQDGRSWRAEGIEVEFGEGGVVNLRSPTKPVSKLEIVFKGGYPTDTGVRVYRDAWERTYGMAGWYPMTPWKQYHPWYMLVNHRGRTDGIGVAVQPNAFACWQPEKGEVRLHLDVRAGTDGVELGARTLEVCRLVTRKGEAGETAYAAARKFAKLMCPKPRLPKEPVYGYNDWYCAYGKNTATNFLADAAYVSACAKGLKVRPYVVMDDGWQLMSPPEIKRRTGAFDSGRGPWNESSAQFGMKMQDFSKAIAALGAKPGLWYRPFRAWDGTGDDQLTLSDKRFFDPSLPEMRQRILDDVGRFRAWGMKLVKVDYLTYDVSGVWGPSMQTTPMMKTMRWHRRDRTTAEVMLDCYRALREAAGDEMVIIGCNAVNHFAAGLFEVQRTGDDTSGREWERTEKMGVNTLAMRLHQDGIFFQVDADCAGLVKKGAVPWARNRQWIELLGRTGTAVFISWFRDLADEETRRTIAAAYRRAAEGGCDAEPLDWMATRFPRTWRFGARTRTFDWRENGAEIDPLAALTPKPVKVERHEGSFDALEVAAKTTCRTGAVAGAPATVADEAYELVIGEQGITITASSSRGAHWAKVTLEQLQKLSGGDLPCCRIVDWPALKWRGFMNDCGRNYLDFEAVKTLVDVMSRAKMNLFHWHLTDYHGWRLESKRYPAVTADKTFTRQVGKFYTQDQFRELVAYAAERGVTVMPELDVPGHSLALRRGLGVESMADPKAIQAVNDLLEELCGLAPKEVMPFVHLGTDEARAWPEYLDDKHVSGWARTINRCGRRAVVWAPGIRLDKDIDVVDMAWHDNQVTNSVNPYFDAARMYNGSWVPFKVAPSALFLKPCRWVVDPARTLGAVTCTWHDDNVGEDTTRLFNDAMVLPSIVAFGDNYWSGRVEDRAQYVMPRLKLPVEGTAEAEELAAFEHRLALQRDYVYGDVKYPFPFLEQSGLRWKLTDEKGAVVAESVTGGTLDLAAYAKGSVKKVVAECVITSDVDCVVGAWIDFMSYGSAYSRNARLGTPKIGEWNLSGAKVYVNDVEILPPVWENPGAKSTFERYADNPISWGDDLCEQPYRDEGPTRRALTPIRLKVGANRVKLVMPRTSGAFWGGTFSPALGTAVHPHEIQ